MSEQGPRIVQSTTTIGFGPYELQDPQPKSFTRYRDVFPDGTATTIIMLDQSNGTWAELLVRLTYGVPDTLTTVGVISSSEGGSAISFGAGSKLCFQSTPSYGSQAVDRIKPSVRAAITSNVTVSSVTAGSTLDGVTLAAGDRVGLFGQSTAAQNGLYVVQASGAPVRAKDCMAGDTVSSAIVAVAEGTANIGRIYVCTSPKGSDTVGTHSLVFTQAIGSNGADGANGATWRVGTGVPSNGTGQDGDLYLRTSTGEVYQRAAGTYSVIANIVVGTPGTPGTVMRNGTGAPSNSLGINGDYYFDGSTGNVYLKSSGAYSVVANIRGPAGSAGANGTNGNVMRNGSGAPSNSLGANGDYYLDTVFGDLYFRTAGTYSVVANIVVGTPGTPGAAWDVGTGVPSNGSGQDGDLYLDGANGDVYLKTAGSYSVVANIKGLTGSAGPTGAGYTATSTTSLVTAGSGSKSFTTQSGLAYSVGARIRATSTGSSEWMEGVVTSYSSTTLVVTMDLNSGTGTHTDWNINLAGQRGATGATGSTGAAGTIDGTTLSTLTGVLKANGSNVGTATAGTDYVAPGATTTFTKQQVFGGVALTDATTIAWDVEVAQSAKVTLGGNRTLGAPTHQIDGGTYILRVKQDGTGNRTLSYNSVFKWPGGTAPTLSTSANALDILTFVSDGTNMYGVAQKAFS